MAVEIARHDSADAHIKQEHSADVHINQEHSQTSELGHTTPSVDLETLPREALQKLLRGGALAFEASVRLTELEAKDRAANPRHASREELRVMAAQGSTEACVLLEELRAKDRAAYYQRKARIAAGNPTTVASHERQRLNNKKRNEKKRKARQLGSEKTAISGPGKVDAVQPVPVMVSEQDVRELESTGKLFDEVWQPEDIEMERWQEESEEVGETPESPALLPRRSDRALCLSVWEALGS